MTIQSSKYNIELRNKDGELKSYLTPFCSNIKWEWNRLGGCGRCSITVNKAYRDILFDTKDDIRIRIKDPVYNSYMPNTKLLLHCDGADESTTFTDTGNTVHTVTRQGTAQVDTAQYKFSTGSCLLDGDSDYLTVPDHLDWYFGANNFTVDFWVRFNDKTGNQMFFSQFEDGNNFFYMWKDANHKLEMNFGFGAADKGHYIMTDAWAGLADDTWYHVAFVRNGIVGLIFIDGVSQALTETIAFAALDVGDIVADLWIGAYENGPAHYVNGWIDEPRILKGTAKWTANFTPPTREYDDVVPPTKLVYRGYIANIVPKLKVNQDIKLDVRGYFDLLKKLIVHTTGDTRSYPDGAVNLIHEIVDDIVDTFVVANSDITKGTIDTTDGSAFDIDAIDFLGSVDDALRTLAEIAGDVEYGVDEDLVFFWRTESTTINRRFFIGNNVSLLERRVIWDKLVNKLYLVGGDVAGSKYKGNAENTESQALYGLAEEIINNSSITTAAVKTQYLGTILTARSIPQLSIRAKVNNINFRLEDTIPMGLMTFYDAEYDQTSLGDTVGDIIGAASNIETSSIANPSMIFAKHHGFLTGQSVVISGHAGETPEIEGTHTITCLTRDIGTDLASADGDANPAVVTSASHTFVAADVGHYIHVSAGTGWTVGWYAIASVAAGAATLDGPVGADGALTGGTWQLGEDSFSIPVNVTADGTGGTATSSPSNGSDIRIGETGDGGDDVTIGGEYSAQIDRISYDLSDTDERVNINIQLGDTILETAAKIKRLELQLASVTQYDQ